MSAGMFLKLDGKTAAKFSFLMAIPAIGGGAILDFKDIVAFPKEGILQLLIGMTISFIVAYISIKWLLGIISKGKFFWFSLYCWAAGLITLGYLVIR
jgi:undecaprenyl-diphosphatase